MIRAYVSRVKNLHVHVDPNRPVAKFPFCTGGAVLDIPITSPLKTLAKILYNRRHITADGGDDADGVSVWLTARAFNRIPLMIRKVANGIVAFKLKNVKEIISIYDEFVVGLTKEQFLDILKYVYKNPFDFLFINMDEPWDEMYHRNFFKLLMSGV
eukprot:SAG11_NODE_1052_length_6029_cov_4.823946_5_plen_156_part_00